MRTINDLKQFDVLGVPVSVTDLTRTCQVIEGMISRRQKGYICVAPVSTIVAAREEAGYRDVLNKASVVTPDGMPLVWLGRARGFKDIARTYGPDLMTAFFSISSPRGYRHFLYGGTPRTLAALENRLKRQFPGVNIIGSYAPPFGDFSEEEERRTVRLINEAAPDVLWVGLGSPRQDRWMADHIDKLNVPVMVGVGAAFDFLSGQKKQAPLWMQRSGLEWLFRLVCEPRRLWKRYLVGNARFIGYLLGDWWRWLTGARK